MLVPMVEIKSPNTAFLVHAALSETPPADAWRPELSPAWRERLAGMRSESARRRTLAGLWLLREAASMAGLPEPTLTALRHDANGRPELPDGPIFNISHSGLHIACAITAPDTPVGLDVERIRPIDPGRFARFLKDDDDAARDAGAFFTAWTAREAVVKAGGRVGLARIARVRIDGNRAELDGERLHLQWPEVGTGVVACLASAAKLAAVWVREVEAPI